MKNKFDVLNIWHLCWIAPLVFAIGFYIGADAGQQAFVEELRRQGYAEVCKYL